MKFKKILAFFASMVMFATVGSNMVMATNSYGSPSITGNVEYPVDMYGDTYLCVKVNYSGFTGFSAYNAFSKKGIGLGAAQVELKYDETALTYVTTLNGDAFTGDPATGNDKPAYAIAFSDTGMISKTKADNFAQFYFKVNDGVDFSKQEITFDYNVVELTVKSNQSGVVTIEVYGTTNAATDTIKADAFTYGTKASTSPKAEIAEDGKVSFTDLKDADKTIGADEQLIMDSANKEQSTFNSNSKVKIFYQKDVVGEEQSKLSSQTLFELLGIESTGTATGTVRFGVKAPSTMTGVFSFEIVEE